MGLSTHWVFSEYSRAQEQYQEFLHIRDNFRHDLDDAYRRINKLKKEIDELKAKFKTLHTDANFDAYIFAMPVKPE